jgi:hypothetical protein
MNLDWSIRRRKKKKKKKNISGGCSDLSDTSKTVFGYVANNTLAVQSGV